jgi:hypothetical protein
VAASIDALLETHLATAEAHLETIRADPTATLRPVGATMRHDADVVARLAKASEPRLKLHERLGQGGMGVVHLATQTSLGRQVAVKATRPDRSDEVSVAQVMREAWITGSLEHPNVVPIYDVELDDDGRPLIVMRRIEGQHWGELMHDAAAIRARDGAVEPLEWNLRVLRSVCNALELAHSRGVLHRDLKPENVMLGKFGEVYLLDWGLALSGDHSLRQAQPGMVGTPAYMAPEMLGGGPDVSVRTDVYLLGATLYELVTGKPPHGASTVRELFRSVLESNPVLPPETPPLLGSICRRAMARDPEDRHRDVAAFRAAIDEFLRFRVADQIVERAGARLAQLEARLASSATRGELYELFGECRFGFREALAQRPDHDAARDGLVRVTRIMIERELGDGDARAASLLLAQLDGPPPDLVAAVADASRSAEIERERREALERLGRDLDPSVGKRTRSRFAFTLAGILTLLPLMSGVRVHVRQQPMAAWEILVWPLVMTAGVLFVAALGRKSLMLSAINRRMVGVLATMTLAMEVGHVGLLTLGLPVADIQVIDICFMVGMGAAWTAFVDTKLWPTVVFFTLAFLGASLWPDRRFFVLAAGNFCCLLTFIWAWSPRHRAT